MSCPVGTTKEASNARTPWRMYSCSRFSGLPGCTGWVGNARCKICMPGLFVGADHYAPVVVETERLDIELTDIVGFGFEVGIVAIEPVHTPMRLQVCLFQDTPQTGATHGLPALLAERCDQIVETPSGGPTMIRGRFLGRHRQHIHPFSGGKAPRATRARRILQALEAMQQIALPPTADGMPLTGHFGGYLRI